MLCVAIFIVESGTEKWVMERNEREDDEAVLPLCIDF
jgi:hypothetical protein